MTGLNRFPDDRASEEQQSLQWLWGSRAIFSLPEVLYKSELTYAMILDYFAQCQAADLRIHKSVVLREKLPEGVRIVQVFLDRANQLTYATDTHPYGRRLLVQGLDQQLSSSFGKNHLIILGERGG
jgi:hypothetical protein